MWLLLLLASHLALALAGLSSDSCMVEGEACLVEGDTMLATIPGIPDVATCRQHCQVFRSCRGRHGCRDCRTEARACYNTCAADLQGAIGENDLEVITGVTAEVDCKLHCSANPACGVYTYFDTSHPHYPGLCFLLTEVLEPIEPCEHCRTGFPDCGAASGDGCSFTTGSDPAPKQSP